MRQLRVLRPLEGKGGWTILPIHYSHDPEKTEAWMTEARASYPHEAFWRREMEMDMGEVVGTRAYAPFSRALHVRPEAEVVYNPMLPLALCCDFNVGFMSWPVCQEVNGMEVVIDEITMEPADVAGMVREFRNRFPAHPAELWIYGDASGNARSVQSQKSNYDLMRVALKGYSSDLIMRVPPANPPVTTRLNSVCMKLKAPSGKPGVVISDKCVELIADLEEVLLDPKGHGELQIRDPQHPYARRTHSSSGWGYRVVREWPVTDAVQNAQGDTALLRPLRFSDSIPGDL